jgi:hypothetical protein
MARFGALRAVKFAQFLGGKAGKNYPVRDRGGSGPANASLPKLTPASMNDLKPHAENSQFGKTKAAR